MLGTVTDAEGIEDGRAGVDEERLIGGGTRVALTGTEVVKVVVRGGETEVTVEVIVVIVSDTGGVDLPGGATETLTLTLTERDIEVEPEAEEAGAELDTGAELDDGGRDVACPAADETRRKTATRALKVEYIVSVVVRFSQKKGR